MLILHDMLLVSDTDTVTVLILDNLVFILLYDPGQLVWEAVGRHWYAGHLACKVFKVCTGMASLMTISMLLGDPQRSHNLSHYFTLLYSSSLGQG